LFHVAYVEARVRRIEATSAFAKGRHPRDIGPMPCGTATVLGSHSCGALSPVAARPFYQTMLEAQSGKLQGPGDSGPGVQREKSHAKGREDLSVTASARREFAALGLQHVSNAGYG
jgi:hypothetical protein